MILRSGERRQAEELDDVDRQLLLDDGDVAADSSQRVGGKAQNVPGDGYDALRLPGEQHLAIFDDLVLALLGGGEIVGVYVLKPDEDAGDAGTFRLLDEVRDAVAEGIDLDHETKRDAGSLAQLDQPIENRLPLLVAGEIVVGDKELADAVCPVGAHELLDLVGRAEARLAPLHIDDGAERTLIRAATPGIETGAQPKRALDVLLGKDRHRRATEGRQ